MTVSKNNPAPQLNVKPATAPKAQAPQHELINRKMVAAALDRAGANGSLPDGIITREEFEAAGIRNLDAEALAAINRGGEKGDAITVNELAQALGDDRVAISGEGNVSIQNGYARLSNGRLQTSGAWAFPHVEGLRILEDVRRIAPSGWSGYNPDYPSANFVDEEPVRDRYGNHQKYEEGMSLGSGEFARDGYIYRNVTDYERLESVLREKARAIESITRNAKDPEIKQIHDEVYRLVWQNYWSGTSSRDRARDLYNALARFDRIDVPTDPEARMTTLNGALNTAKTRIDEQFRIARDIPVDRARQAVAREVERLKGATAANFVGSGVGLVGAGVAGFFGLGAVLSGGALILAAAGAAAVGAGLGWMIGKWTKDSKAKGLQQDLQVLSTISPERNQQDLNQYAVVGYKLLQDARVATTLAKVRSYDEDAEKATGTINQITQRIANQTASLKTMEDLVNKYGG